MEFVLFLIGIAFGAFLAVRKVSKKKKREQMIDEFLEKYTNEKNIR